MGDVGAAIFVVFYSGDHDHADPKLHFSEDALPTLDTFLKRTKEARVFRRTQAVRAVVTGQRLQTVSDTLHFTYSSLQNGSIVLPPRARRTRGSPPLRASPQSHLRLRTAPQSPRRPRPPGAWLRILPVELSRARHRLSPANRCPTRSRKCARGVKKNTLSYCRPTGRLDPTPADLADGSLNWLPWSTGLAGAKSFYSTKMKPSCGALPCPGWAGGAAPSAIVSPRGPAARVKSNAANSR